MLANVQLTRSTHARILYDVLAHLHLQEHFRLQTIDTVKKYKFLQVRLKRMTEKMVIEKHEKRRQLELEQELQARSNKKSGKKVRRGQSKQR